MKGGFKELLAYKLAYELAMTIFKISEQFPKEERYALTDQIRRSSRAVCANIAEGYRKRLYIKHYISKLTDADGECSETIVWLNFAKDCNYISVEKMQELEQRYEEVGKLIAYMMNNPEKFGVKL